MRLTLPTAAAALLAALSASAAKPLPRPIWGDPTLQAASSRAYPDDGYHDHFTAYVATPGLTGLTFCGWFRFDHANAYRQTPLFAMAMFSNKAARSGREGGAKLPNLTSSNWWDGADDLPLGADGTWAETCLPASYALPNSYVNDDFRYGCYAVNVSTDAPLTLTVSGYEVQVPVTNFWAFNAPARAASRAVSVAASSPSAHVRLGIAENPLVQFVGAQFDNNGGYGDDLYGAAIGGIVSNEWRFVVARARIDGGTNLAVSVCGYGATNRFANAQSVSQPMWRPTAAFERDARFRLLFASLVNMTNVTVRSYGMRAYGAALDDALVERMRDQDWAEMARRGLVPQGED